MNLRNTTARPSLGPSSPGRPPYPRQTQALARALAASARMAGAPEVIYFPDVGALVNPQEGGRVLTPHTVDYVRLITY